MLVPFCEALGVIKIMKSVQSSANSGFWPVEDGDAFWASFFWPGAFKMEATW